jgi:hypothetical protein
VLADLIVGADTRFDVAPFAAERFLLRRADGEGHVV